MTRDPLDEAAFNKRSKETKTIIREINDKSFHDFLLSLDRTKDSKLFAMESSESS